MTFPLYRRFSTPRETSAKSESSKPRHAFRLWRLLVIRSCAHADAQSGWHVQAARMNQQDLSFERNARNSPYLSGGLGVISPRIRSSSFSGIGSSPQVGAYPRSPLLSDRIGTYGGSSVMTPLSGLGNVALQRERLRSQTRALEAEALRRVRSSSSAQITAEDLPHAVNPAAAPCEVPLP